jgi:phage terminase large subunit GpA-like protein
VKWRTREPQRAILDAFDNDRIEDITVLKSSRFGWTSILMCAMDYFITHDPSPIVMVQPRVTDMEEWSKDQVQATIDASPAMSALVAKQRAGSSGNTVDHKDYPGGPLRLRASNSPDGFRRWSARIGMCDEIDGYPLSAGREGDVLSLLWTRLQDSWNRVLATGSTPTEADISAVWRRFKISSRGYPFLVCPHCGESHIRLFRVPKEPIVIRGVDAPISFLNWEAGKPHTAHYVCPANGCVITQKHHNLMLDSCYWVGEDWEYKNRKFEFLDSFDGRIGFYTWAGYIISPNTTPSKLADRWEKDSGNIESKKVFVNTVEGRPWEDEGESLNSSVLVRRKEEFKAEVPAGACYLSAGVDVQGNPARWEIEVVAWGDDEENWSVDYQIIFGDTSMDAEWDEVLKPFLTNKYVHESGLELPISAVGIDHGFESKRVETFIHKLNRVGVYAFKGMPGEG